MAAIPVTLALVLIGALYLRGWFQLQAVAPATIAPWRAGSFLSGLLCLWLAVGSPLAHLDKHLLTFHMVQHLLLMTIGPPLILLGAPILPLLHSLPGFLTRAPPPSFRLNLAFCWVVATTVLIGWHIPSAFELGRSSESWHQVEHATFLGAGLLFWWPVIPSRPSISQPRWSTVLYLFAATLPCDALSAFLAFCGRVVYSSYLDMPPHFNLSPLQDQECAGALMWTVATFAYLIPAVLTTARLLSSSTITEEAATTREEAGD